MAGLHGCAAPPGEPPGRGRGQGGPRRRCARQGSIPSPVPSAFCPACCLGGSRCSRCCAQTPPRQGTPLCLLCAPRCRCARPLCRPLWARLAATNSADGRAPCLPGACRQRGRRAHAQRRPCALRHHGRQPRSHVGWAAVGPGPGLVQERRGGPPAVVGFVRLRAPSPLGLFHCYASCCRKLASYGGPGPPAGGVARHRAASSKGAGTGKKASSKRGGGES